jgi:hypothetical protein
MNEIWKPLIINTITYNYEVSNLGNIRSTITKRVLKSVLRNGYLSLSISKNNIKKTYNIHQLIALVFLGNKKDNTIIINHKNGNKTDNNINNLEYITYKENTQHAIENKLTQKVTKKVHKLDPNTLQILKTYNSLLEAGEDNNIDAKHISCVCKGRRLTTGGFSWKYVNDINMIIIQENNDNKIIKNYPNYLITKEGKVYSKRLTKYLEPKILPSGYHSVKLCNDTIMHDFYIHVLVAENFLELPKIDRKLLIVNHKDGYKSNNKLSNLEWATQKENMDHYQKVLKKVQNKTVI